MKTFASSNTIVASCLPLLALALAPAAPGCLNSEKSNLSKLLDRDTKVAPAQAGKPKLNVKGKNLGESQEVTISADQLHKRVHELIEVGQSKDAAALILKFPDAALEYLRCNAAPGTRDDAQKLMAATHDKQCVTNSKTQGWSQLCNSTANPKITAYADARKRFKELLAQGSIDTALKLDLPRLAHQTDFELLKIDACQLNGTAQLLGDHPDKANDFFAKAIQQSTPVSEYQTTYLMLLQSDAQRRLGHEQPANDLWSHALDMTCRGMTVETPTFDPVQWERLGYLRPVTNPWPETVIRVLQVRDPLPALMFAEGQRPAIGKSTIEPAVAEAVIWNAVGMAYLNRGQPQAALICFKRAESAAPEPATQQYLRFREANALVQLGQTGPATAILVALVSESKTAEAPAKALLGSLRLKSGQIQQGTNLLRQAIEQSADGADWAERPQAVADLGLALLIKGDEKEGLDRLHQAQEMFEAHHDVESLALSLENEAVFFEQTKRKKEAADIRQRLTKLQAA